ncbi:MAG: tryptophan--tRNA ligase [Bacilli bacterium]|nr:tryptophan--tRNA ligase [Bacilli bacterium]
MKRILTGLQPSGELTIGSLIGGISQTIKYQDEYESFIFVPDLHAITVPQDAKLLHERIKKNVALYIASGVNPEKNTIYIQSDNLYHTNLAWILECNTYMGEASRMTQFKDKSSKFKNIPVGLFTYPILMASDILLYDADYVPVGIDQKQHVELARDIAIRFNGKYGDTFKIPEPLIPKTGAKIMDLQDPTKKMSKSETNPKGIIYLLDDEKTIRKKIMSAVTDSEAKVCYDPEKKPGISNLLTIYAYFKKVTIEESEKEFIGKNYGEFKTKVADIVVEELLKIQEKYNEIMKDNQIDIILNKGKEITTEIAKKKYEEVVKKIGLGR